MPNAADNLRNIANRLVGTDFQLADSRNNPVGLPLDSVYSNILDSLQPKKRLVRTNVPNISRGSKIDMSGQDGFSIFVSIVNPDGSTNQPGFTPQSSYYLYGASLIDNTTGYAKEAGHILCVATLVNNCAVDKISRTNLAINPDAADTKGKVLLTFSKESVKGKQNIWGNQNISSQETFGGWVNPLHYINNPDDINPKTGLPLELGDFPYNYNNKFGANFFRGETPGIGVNSLIPTTPKSKVDGPENDGIKSKKEVFTHFREAKDPNIRLGGYEMYDFVHHFDRLQALENPNSNPNDIYLATFVDVKEHEDPVWFGFDIFIDFESSPLFNGAIYEFIREKQSTNQEVRARAEVYQNFLNQFRRFFKLQTSNDPVDPSGTQSNSSLIIPVSNPVQNGRTVYKTFYIKKMMGLDFLVESLISNANDQIKSMVNWGTDLIKLTLYEDVTVNTGYLAMLYKTLSWSRLNGKQIIPENLLRFDCKIVINEVRNYNKIMKNNNGIDVFADDLNKYIYTLYDCQFMFDKMSHGDDINMWAGEIDKEFDIAFNFKYSNLAFEKNISNRPSSIRKWTIDNRKISPISFEDKTNALNLKYYQRFEPNAELTTDLTAASLRNVRRQLGDDAVGDIIPDATIQQQQQTLTPEEFSRENNQLEDVRLFQAFAPEKGPWEKYSESSETNLELLSKQSKNKELFRTLEEKFRLSDTGSYNRKKDLISRAASSIIEGFETQTIGVPYQNLVSATIPESSPTSTVDTLRLDLKDSRKVSRFLQKNDFESSTGNTELSPGNYLFVATRSTDLATAQESAVDLIRGRPSNEISNLIAGRSQIYYKKMNDNSYQYNFFSPII